MPRTAVVLGAGMVGTSVALHLRRRGWDVALLDRNPPGEGASFGNAGLIQREAVFPHGFPRAVAELARIARNRSIDARYHPLALPALASPLLRFWMHSHPKRYLRAVEGHARLIATCLDEHRPVAQDAGSTHLLRPIGYLHLHADPARLEEALALAARAREEWGVSSTALDPAALAAAEPHLTPGKAGAIHWTDPYSVSDPHALTTSYAALFEREGGQVLRGDAATLSRQGGTWRVQGEDGPVEAEHAVVALGAASARLTAPLGYRPPLFGKRGYHHHYRLRGNAVLNRPVLDADNGFLLAPMRAGVRLTTGAEFTRPQAPPTPTQLRAAEPIARALLPIDEAVEDAPWMGTRPCTPDMLPVIGSVPRQDRLWAAFGHAHQGLTLGPTTGRLLAEMMSGEAPFLDPEPYRADRF